MRQALRLVKEALGADAVILSNNRTDGGGVELVAAIDLDEAAPVRAEPASREAEREAVDFSSVLRRERPSRRNAPESLPRDEVVTPMRQPSEHRRGDQARTMRRASAAFGATVETTSGGSDETPGVAELRAELASLKHMLEAGFSSLSWQRAGEREPERQHLFRRLIGIGVDSTIANHLLRETPIGEDVEEAWRRAIFTLSGALRVVDDPVLDEGGVIALVGPTGVGKTTTLAKIAARFCLRHGKQQVALVTTDHYRIGARDQLNTYARILDIPIRTASSEEELHDTLASLAERRLILIDTAGMSQKDVRLSEQMAMLHAGAQPVKVWLTLPATIQQRAAEQVIRAFHVAKLSACVLTKLDESVSLGGVLSALIRNGLPLNYVTDGQRVPEDLHPARAFQLFEQAAAQLPEDEPSEDFLAMAFAEAGTHAHG